MPTACYKGHFPFCLEHEQAYMPGKEVFMEERGSCTWLLLPLGSESSSCLVSSTLGTESHKKSSSALLCRRKLTTINQRCCLEICVIPQILQLLFWNNFCGFYCSLASYSLLSGINILLVRFLHRTRWRWLFSASQCLGTLLGRPGDWG